MPDRLNASAPLVVDTRDLGRRPGSLRRLAWTAPAPKDVGNAVLHVPAGEDVDLDLRLEAVMDGVLVSGTAGTRARGECVRCLEPVEYDIEVDLQELYSYADTSPVRSGGAGAGRAAPREDRDPDEDGTSVLEGDLLDLEPVLRDALVLALPLQPRCDDECPGLCVDCGARLADDPEHAHDVVDSRWAALGALAASPAPAGPDLTSMPGRRAERVSLN